MMRFDDSCAFAVFDVYDGSNPRKAPAKVILDLRSIVSRDEVCYEIGWRIGAIIGEDHEAIAKDGPWPHFLISSFSKLTDESGRLAEYAF
jgi:hypothetical protein